MKSVLLVGTVSNVEKTFEKDFHRVIAALAHFESVSVYLIESDSSDLTVNLLEEIRHRYSNFNFISLGSLQEEFPDRIERLRRCRNEYVDWIRKFGNSDFICVADLDGMNHAISIDNVRGLFETGRSWDACFSNQLRGYSDLYALRCDDWLNFDIFQRLQACRAKYIQTFSLPLRYLPRVTRWFIEDLSRREVIYRNMKILSPNSDWIRVNSAFGGLGIYKRECFLYADYGLPNGKNIVGSEHLELHAQLIQQKRELFIVPSLVNANWNTYNINRYFLVRQFREFARQSKFVSQFLRFVFMR